MRIGILQTDSVMERFEPEFGNYPAMFHKLLGREDGAVCFADYDVEHGHYPAHTDECDGYVITGSRRSVYDDEPWIHRLKDYVVELHETRSKLVGICFGHQMVAEALGGKTEAAAVGWHVGVNHNTVVSYRNFMTPEASGFNLIFSHKDQVVSLPPGAELLATSEFCPNAMFCLGEHILAFQGHPEFCKGYSKVLMELREDVLGEDKFSRGMASLANRTDEELIGRWITNFVAGP